MRASEIASELRHLKGNWFRAEAMGLKDFNLSGLEFREVAHIAKLCGMHFAPLGPETHGHVSVIMLPDIRKGSKDQWMVTTASIYWSYKTYSCGIASPTYEGDPSSKKCRTPASISLSRRLIEWEDVPYDDQV